MNTSDIFQLIHSNKGRLKRIKDKETIDFIVSQGLNPEYFYKVKDSLNSYCYMNGTVYLNIYSMEKDIFKLFQYKYIIEKREAIHKECFKTKDYQRLFVMIDKPFRLYWYKRLFDEIPDEDKYNIFEFIYTCSEYGFDSLERDFIEKVFSYNKNEKVWLDELEDEVTIYRGEGSLSTPYTRAYSWTTNIKIAKFFATRFGSCGTVYKAKVKKDDILDYLFDSNESEILVYPEKVYDVEIVDIN